MIAALIIAGLFAGSLWAAIVDPRRVALATVFLAPWGGLDVDIGLRVTAYQVVLGALCVSVAVRSTMPGWRTAPVPGFGLLLVFALWSICWSLLQIGFVPQLRVGDSLLRGPEARAVIQIALFVFGLAPIVLLAWLLPGRNDLSAIGRTYLLSALALAAIGWLQLGLWYGTGWNPLPVGAVNVLLGGSEAYNREGLISLGQGLIYRMNSLAGEPRNLGTTLVMAMLLIQAVALTTPRPRAGLLLAMWLVLFASILATFSTSAVLVWLVGSAALLPGAWMFGVPVRRSARGIAGAIMLLVAPALAAVAAAEAGGIPVVQILSERTVERLTESGAVEDFDLAIIEYMTRHPQSALAGVGLGNAHLYATPYLLPEFAVYAEGNVFVAKTQYLKLVSETGVIGLVLFVAWFGRLAQLAARGRQTSGTADAMLPLAVAALAVLMATTQIANEFLVLAGGLAALANLAPAPRLASLRTGLLHQAAR